VKALLLCGGHSTRMWPLAEDKFLLDLLGKPLVVHMIDMLAACGVTEVVLVANASNAERLRSIVSPMDGVTCRVVEQDSSATVMADAIESARDHLQGPILIVSSSDVVELSAYRKVTEAATHAESDACILACRQGHHFRGGYLVTDERMNVSHIEEKPDEGSEPSDLVNVVVHFHRDGRRLLDALSRVPSEEESRYQTALNLLIDEGCRVVAVPYVGFWVAMKHPWDVLPVMEQFIWRVHRSVSDTVRVAKSALIDGTVVIARNARVMENAVIRGPAYIGENVVVGNNVLIRGGAHIGAGSVIGFSTEVKRAYIGKNCWFHSNYIGDSVVEDGCAVASGSVVANLRLDEWPVSVDWEGQTARTGLSKLGVVMGRACRVGINASLMPGVLLGVGSYVGPHVCLTSNLGDGMRAMSTGGYVVDRVNRIAPETNRQEMWKKLAGK